MRRIKILYLIPTLERGGAEKDVALLVRGLASQFEIKVYPFLGGGPLATMLPSAVIVPPKDRVRKLNGDKRLSSLSEKLAFVGDISFSRHGEMFDIVHAVLPNSYILAGLMRVIRPELWKARLVMSRYGLNWHQERWIYWLGERMLHKAMLAHAVANCSSIARELAAEGISENRITVIPNGMDVDGLRAAMVPRAEARLHLSVPADVFTITCVGNLWPERKGQLDLLSALAIADLEHDWVLLFVGRDHGGYQKQLEKRAAALGVLGRVRFLGLRDDVPIVLSASDLHVSASHTEGLPNNILEAMAAGVAVVATDVGGTSDLVVDKVTGRLVPPCNPLALATAIRSLVINDAYRARLALRGAERARQYFGVQAFLDAHAALYRSLLGKQFAT